MVSEEIPYLIHSSKFWSVELYWDNQIHLGRCVVFLKNRPIANPLNISKEERDELWTKIFPSLDRALRKSFNVNIINFAHLANTTRRVHWHVVPRYKEGEVIKFAGTTFKDVGANEDFALSGGRTVTPAILRKIYSKIKKNYKSISIK